MTARDDYRALVKAYLGYVGSLHRERALDEIDRLRAELANPNLHVLTEGQHVVERRPAVDGEHYLQTDAKYPVRRYGNRIEEDDWVVVKSGGTA